MLNRIPAWSCIHYVGPTVQISCRAAYTVNKSWPRFGTERYHHSRGEQQVVFVSCEVRENSLKAIIVKCKVISELLSNTVSLRETKIHDKAEVVLYCITPGTYCSAACSSCFPSFVKTIKSINITFISSKNNVQDTSKCPVIMQHVLLD